MGANGSSVVNRDPYSTNDFELVIRLAKDLEYLLSEYFYATGQGLGDKIKSARFNCQPLPREVTNAMWRLNKERNNLVHDRFYNSIEDRQSFILTYERVKCRLQGMITPPSSRSPASGCVIS